MQQHPLLRPLTMSVNVPEVTPSMIVVQPVVLHAGCGDGGGIGGGDAALIPVER